MIAMVNEYLNVKKENPRGDAWAILMRRYAGDHPGETIEQLAIGLETETRRVARALGSSETIRKLKAQYPDPHKVARAYAALFPEKSTQDIARALKLSVRGAFDALGDNLARRRATIPAQSAAKRAADYAWAYPAATTKEICAAVHASPSTVAKAVGKEELKIRNARQRIREYTREHPEASCGEIGERFHVSRDFVNRIIGTDAARRRAEQREREAARLCGAALTDAVAPREMAYSAGDGSAVRSASVNALSDATGIGLADIDDAIDRKPVRRDVEEAESLHSIIDRYNNRGLETISERLSYDPYIR